jgi:hypothetical protein
MTERTTPTLDASAADQFGASSMVFALISLATCWWFPYGAVIGAVGVGWGLLGWCLGNPSERSVLGAVLAACGMGAGVLLAWDYWQRTFGL